MDNLLAYRIIYNVGERRERIMTKKTETLDITGVTLLSTEEAEMLPDRLRRYKHWWWLRSPGLNQLLAVSIHPEGWIYYVGDYVDYGDNYVRPALLISNLSSSSFQIGDCFIFGNKEFEIINEGLALCKTDIGTCAFRNKLQEDDANIYEKSDIKRFVDDWFNNAKERDDD